MSNQNQHLSQPNATEQAGIETKYDKEAPQLSDQLLNQPSNSKVEPSHNSSELQEAKIDKPVTDSQSGNEQAERHEEQAQLNQAVRFLSIQSPQLNAQPNMKITEQHLSEKMTMAANQSEKSLRYINEAQTETKQDGQFNSTANPEQAMQLLDEKDAHGQITSLALVEQHTTKVVIQLPMQEVQPQPLFASSNQQYFSNNHVAEADDDDDKQNVQKISGGVLNEKTITLKLSELQKQTDTGQNDGVEQDILQDQDEIDQNPADSQKQIIGGHDGRWTDEEHELFREAVLIYGKNWNKVAVHVGSRTSAQTRSHAQKYIRKLNKHGNIQNEREFEILNAKAPKFTQSGGQPHTAVKPEPKIHVSSTLQITHSNSEQGPAVKLHTSHKQMTEEIRPSRQSTRNQQHSQKNVSDHASAIINIDSSQNKQGLNLLKEEKPNSLKEQQSIQITHSQQPNVDCAEQDEVMSSHSDGKDEEMVDITTGSRDIKNSTKSVNKNISSKPISKQRSRKSCKSRTSQISDSDALSMRGRISRPGLRRPNRLADHSPQLGRDNGSGLSLNTGKTAVTVSAIKTPVLGPSKYHRQVNLTEGISQLRSKKKPNRSKKANAAVQGSDDSSDLSDDKGRVLLQDNREQVKAPFEEESSEESDGQEYNFAPGQTIFKIEKDLSKVKSNKIGLRDNYSACDSQDNKADNMVKDSPQGNYSAAKKEVNWDKNLKPQQTQQQFPMSAPLRASRPPANSQSYLDIQPSDQENNLPLYTPQVQAEEVIRNQQDQNQANQLQYLMANSVQQNAIQLPPARTQGQETVTQTNAPQLQGNNCPNMMAQNQAENEFAQLHAAQAQQVLEQQQHAVNMQFYYQQQLQQQAHMQAQWSMTSCPGSQQQQQQQFYQGHSSMRGFPSNEGVNIANLNQMPYTICNSGFNQISSNPIQSLENQSIQDEVIDDELERKAATSIMDYQEISIFDGLDSYIQDHHKSQYAPQPVYYPQQYATAPTHGQMTQAQLNETAVNQSVYPSQTPVRKVSIEVAHQQQQQPASKQQDDNEQM